MIAAMLGVMAMTAGTLEALLGDREAVDLARRVESALRSDGELLRKHRNYLRYLDTVPDVKALEERYAGALLDEQFRGLNGAFQDSLREEEHARALFQAYNRFLAEDAPARQGVETLYRVQLTRPDLAGPMNRWLGDFGAIVDRGIRLFQDGSAPATPAEVFPLYRAFAQDPEVREGMLEGLSAARSSADARRNLTAWWEASRNSETELGLRFRRLDEYLRRSPEAFWMWQNRNIAWAPHPAMYAWVQQFHETIRGEPALAEKYYRYLELLREHPELRRRLDPPGTDLGGERGQDPDGVQRATETIRTPEPPRVSRPSVPVPQSPAVRGPRAPLRPNPPRAPTP